MAKVRQFTTLPVRAIADTRLTALEIRCLAVIALHDGMSTVRGTGAGCYARASILADLARTDVTNFSKAASRLQKFGYIIRERQQNDARRFTLRVIYGEDDSWRVDQLSPIDGTHQIVGELTNDCPELVGEPTNFLAQIVGDDESENGSFLRDSRPQYISLNEEIDFVETKELDSVETAQRENFASRGESFPAPKIGNRRSTKDPAEAGYAGGVSIDAILLRQVPHFARLAISNPGAALSHFENAFAAIGRDGSAMDGSERQRWADFLIAMHDEFAAEQTGYRALRLYDELQGWGEPEPVSVDELRDWARAAIRARGLGGQKALAAEAEMPAGTLSVFCSGRNLPDKFRAPLQAACSRMISFSDWSAAA